MVFFIFSVVMFWSNEHDVLLCREVVNLNPFTSKKGSTQRSGMWEKIAQILNKCTVLRFNVDKRSVRDHLGILVNKHKRKLRAEEKASGIAPDEPSELENLLDTIIALEESADAESQESRAEKNEKCENDRAKAEDARFKAMEKLSETRKRLKNLTHPVCIARPTQFIRHIQGPRYYKICIHRKKSSSIRYSTRLMSVILRPRFSSFIRL